MQPDFSTLKLVTASNQPDFSTLKPVTTSVTPTQSSITDTTIGSIPVVKQLNEFGVGVGSAIGKAGLGLAQTFLKGANKIGNFLGTGQDQYNPAIQVLETAKQNIYQKPFQKELNTGFGEAGQFVGNAIPFIETGGAVKTGQQLATGATRDIVTSLAKQGGIKKVLSYFIKTGANVIPEATISGATQYGVSGGDTESAKNVALASGVLSSVTHVGSDIFNSIIPQTAKESAAKTFGLTGKMSLKDASTGARLNDTVGAMTTINNLAPEIKVIDDSGVEKVFDPTKATLTELPQALYQAKNKIYQAYTDLATQAGDNGASFGQSDFNKVVNELDKYSGKGYTPAYSNKARQIIDALYRFGTVNPKDGGIYFPNTSPAEIQQLIESINKDVNPLSDSAGASVAQDASQIIRNILDNKISQATGEGYQQLRNAYSQLKTIETPIINLYKKALRTQSGTFSNDIINGISSVDTIMGLLTHNPTNIAQGGVIYAVKKALQYAKDPQVNLQRTFKLLRDGAGESSASGLAERFLTTPTNTNAFKVGETIGKQTTQAVKDYAENPKLGLSIEDVSKIKITPELKDKVSRELSVLDNTPLTINGKIDMSSSDRLIRLEELKTKVNRGTALTTQETQEAIQLLKQDGIDVLGSQNPTSNLLQEAKKYKSAEEFVKAQDELPVNEVGFHGSQAKEIRGTPNKTKGTMGNAFYLADSPDEALKFGTDKSVNIGGQKMRVSGAYQKANKYTFDLSNLKIKRFKNDAEFFDFVKDPDIERWFRLAGYDGAYIARNGNYAIYNTEKLKLIPTKSQLTDIWNKANKK